MHVTVAAHDFYPDPGSGGTGRYVYETARRMVEAGHRVSVLTRRRGDVATSETIAGVDVYRYDVDIAGETAPSILRQLPAVVEAVETHAQTIAATEPPDVLSFQGPFTSALLDGLGTAAVGGALADAPRVTTFHSPWPTEYAIKTRPDGTSPPRRHCNVAARWLLERGVLARSDAVLTLSELMRSQLWDVYTRRVAPAVVPGGIDTERFHPDADLDGRRTAGDPTLLTVRRLSERMGHDQLLRAFGRLRQTYPGVRLVVAGDGPRRSALEALADRLGVASDVAFLGYVPDENLPGVYASADVFVLPTQELEGFGLATLEALASGTPVVGTPVGATEELLSPLRDRLPADPLTADATPASLAAGLDAWAGLDQPALDDAGEQCREYVTENYTWDETVEGLLDVYERVCRRN